MLSDVELTALYDDLETDLVERKSSAKDRSKIAEAICAYANDLPRHGRTGVIFVGAHDDGSCAGLLITDELLRDLGGLRSDGQIQPFPVMTIQRKRLRDCEIVVIGVQPSDNPPVRFNGRCWIRVGPRRAQATAEEERRLTEKRRWGNLPFDQHGVPGAALADLDLGRFRTEYLPSAIAPEVLAENHRETPDQLMALRLLTRQGLPTNTAILVLGVEPLHFLPGAYIQFARFDGRLITDPIKDRKEITGPLSDQLRVLDERMQANIATAADLSSGREVRHPDYPIVALQELARNAVIHRNYEATNAPTRVYWYSDRIEVLSPGGPFGTVTTENFGQPGVTDYRNPAIAEAAKALGFAQRFGRGIARAQAELQRNGNPAATFDVSATHVLVTVRPRA